MPYRVIAPVVVVKTQGDYGWQWKHLQQGSPVPADAGEEWIACHLRDQMIAEVPAGAAPAAAPLPPPEPVEPLLPPEPKPAARGRKAAEE